VDRYTRRRGSTCQDLVDDLRRLGLAVGDTVFVHSSLSQLGLVDGGPDTVIDALLEVVGPSGTLAMPAFSFRASMEQHLKSGTHFDVRESLSYSGAITEAFRRRPGVRRSIHPTHSVSALGLNTDFLTKGHEQSSTPFGKGTPFAKLLDLDAKIVCLGISIAYVTWYHAFEDLAPSYPLPVYLPEVYTAHAIDYEGKVHLVSTRCHDPAYSAVRIEKVPDRRRLIEARLAALGALDTDTVGTGSAYCLPVRKLYAAMERLVGEGITIYDVPLPRRASE
jgi:aminoglycoside N3'-acetyltransferase